jgi:hypothetical protein
MPLMSRRRSTLDNLLSDIRSNTQEDAPNRNSASGYATPVPTTNRPMSAQEPISPVDALSLGPPSPPVQTATPATARFSMLRWRHFSDGQLSAKARLQADSDKTPPVPPVPLQHQSQSMYTNLHHLPSPLLTPIFQLRCQTLRLSPLPPPWTNIITLPTVRESQRAPSSARSPS